MLYLRVMLPPSTPCHRLNLKNLSSATTHMVLLLIFIFPLSATIHFWTLICTLTQITIVYFFVSVCLLYQQQRSENGVPPFATPLSSHAMIRHLILSIKLNNISPKVANRDIKTLPSPLPQPNTLLLILLLACPNFILTNLSSWRTSIKLYVMTPHL